VQQHDIDVAERIQLAAAVSSQRDKSKRGFRCARFLLRRRRRGGEGMLEQDVDQINATRTNLPAAAAGLMFQAQTVFLDLKKLFVNGENFGRTLCAGNGELVFGVGQDLVKMSSHYISILARGCDSASGL
jgi:hypothetical protein